MRWRRSLIVCNARHHLIAADGNRFKLPAVSHDLLLVGPLSNHHLMSVNLLYIQGRLRSMAASIRLFKDLKPTARHCRNGWHSVIDTNTHLRPAGRHGGGRGPRTLRRRVLWLIAGCVLALLFISLKQAPQPKWQGFVGVRGLQVSPKTLL